MEQYDGECQFSDCTSEPSVIDERIYINMNYIICMNFMHIFGKHELQERFINMF